MYCRASSLFTSIYFSPGFCSCSCHSYRYVVCCSVPSNEIYLFQLLTTFKSKASISPIFMWYVSRYIYLQIIYFNTCKNMFYLVDTTGKKATDFCLFRLTKELLSNWLFKICIENHVNLSYSACHGKSYMPLGSRKFERMII